MLLRAAAGERNGRLALALLAGWTGLIALLWVRDPFTLLFVALATLGLRAIFRGGRRAGCGGP